MIYCFSGTGNTRHVAEALAIRLRTEVHFFSPDELRNPEQATLSSSEEIVVWAFPTYSWGIPPVVRELIRRAKLQFNSKAVHIAVTTCGDDVGNLAKMFRREIRSRGLVAGAVYSVQMPNTYVMMKGFDTDLENVEKQKITASLQRVETIAEAIKHGYTGQKDDMVVRGRFAWFKTAVIYPYFVRFDMSPRGFNVDASTCISCGKCERVCPMANIAYDDEKHPVWGDKCAFCTACYHVCPIHTIGWKKTTRNKGQYRHFISQKS